MKGVTYPSGGFSIVLAEFFYLFPRSMAFVFLLGSSELQDPSFGTYLVEEF